MEAPDQKGIDAFGGRRIIEELSRRRGVSIPWRDRTDEKRKAVLTGCFDKQVKLITSKSKRKAAKPGRRAGKTVTAAAYLIERALSRPDSPCLYIALTLKSAKLLLWPELKRMNKRYGLGMRFNGTDFIAYLPNGSYIQLAGADKSSEIDKYRGNKYLLVVIDESASFGAHLDELIHEVIEPALFDLDGTLVMLGTPANHCTGPFFEATEDPSKGWEVFHWTMRDNPFIEEAERKLAEVRQRNGWDPNHPSYLREYEGVWVRSDDDIVYHWKPGRNTYKPGELPDQPWDKVLGIDIGFVDAAAFAVWGFTPKQPETWLLDGYKESFLTPSEIAERVRRLERKHDGFNRIVCDPGGGGKGFIEEWRKRSAIPIHEAEKHKKNAWIKLMNDDLIAGRIKVPEGHVITDEWTVIQWDEKRRFEDDRFPNDMADAGLYGWRESYHWTHVPEEDVPEYGSDEHWDREAERLEKAEIEALAMKRIREANPEMWDDEEEFELED